MTEPRIFTCEEWGALPVHRAFPTKPAVGTVIHHTASPNATPLLGPEELHRSFKLARAIQRDHLARRWADTGQHFLVSRGGIILEGRHGSLAAARRGRCVRGSHAGNNLANSQWFGIETEGRYDQEFLVTDAQWQALVTLHAWLAHWGDFDTATVQPHSHFRPTECPGHLRDHLGRLRQEAHDLKMRLRFPQDNP
jgi:N-acetyl-anhydromuramyl-L-alanine amidase AmpD